MAIFTTDNTILAKSPYIYAAEGNPILTTDYIIIDLYIYQGDITADRPASPTISIRKDAIDGRRVVVEVSNIIESYFGSGSSYVESKDALDVWWVHFENTAYYTNGTNSTYLPVAGTSVAFNGYAYSNGDFNSVSLNILQSNSTIYVLNDNIVKVPMSFYYDGGTTTENVIVEYFENGNLVSSTTYTYSEDTADWVFIASPYSFDNFRDRVTTDGGIIEDNVCNDRFFDRYEWGEIDEIRVTGNGDNGVGTKTTTLNVEYLEECRNDAYKVTFRNRFGVPQEIYMRGKYMESTNFKNEVLKRSTRSSLGSFNKQDFSYKKFNSNGRKQITLNTGFVKENQNEVFRQFLLSDSVWLTNLEDNSTIPVVVKNQSLEYKTSLNDKLINYTIEFEYAHDDIEVYF